jgi:predicted ribonuclease YlaK
MSHMTDQQLLYKVIERMLGQSLFACVSLHKSERSSLSDIAADLL